MKLLNLDQSINLTKKYGIPFAKGETIKKENELEQKCKKIGYPIAMKIISDKIIHKTDKGGVQLNIKNLEEAKKTFNKMKKLDGFKGTYIQQMIKGKEIIIGGKTDPQFGPTILFGLGGIYVELLKDYSLRICPITKKDSQEMIKEIKGHKLLTGMRGEKSVNIKKIEDTLLKVNNMMMKEKIKEIDLNPLIATEKDVLAIDARIIL